MEKPCYLIDILPEQVSGGNAGQYFAIEKYFLKDRALKKFSDKITAILLMLNCYYDFKVDRKGKWKRNPSPKKLAGLLHSCIQRQDGTVSILIGGEDTMAVVK